MVSRSGAAGAARLRALCGAATLCDGDAGSPGGAEAGHPLARLRADTFRVRSSRACWNSLARPLRRLSQALALCASSLVGAVEPGSDREPYDKARVEIYAYSGLRRLLLVSYWNASLVNFCVDKTKKTRRARTAGRPFRY